jgi:hypothetical protein
MAYVKPGTAGTFERIERLEQAEIDAAMKRLNTLAQVMDSLFVIPGTGLRLGVDSILGLVPVVGDVLAQIVSAYLIMEARRLGVSKLVLWRMVGNSLIDTAVGAVPLVGDAFDVAFKANIKNLRLLQRHLEKRGYRPSVGGSGNVIDGSYERVA